MRFGQVIGHKELKNQLIKELKGGKVSHAQLFVGKTGHGTLPLALAFIQYLFCENKQDNDSCGKCESCLKVADLQHPDLHFSFPTVQAVSKIADHHLADWRSLIKENPYFDTGTWQRTIDEKERSMIVSVAESANIMKKLSLKSYEGGYKVMLIYGLEYLNPSSANKMLKILEEPPEKTLFILLAEQTDRILQTILSRAQSVLVPAVSEEDLSEFIQQQFQLGRQQADSVAARSEGNVWEAMRSASAEDKDNVNREAFIQMMRVCYKKDVDAMIQWALSTAEMSKEAQKVFIQYALYMIRQSLLRNYTQDQLTRTSEEEGQFLRNFSRFITGNNAADFMKIFDDGFYAIERNASAKILFTNICFHVMRFIHKA